MDVPDTMNDIIESEPASADHSDDEFDNELSHNFDHYGWPWNGYKKIVNAYLQGPDALKIFLDKNEDDLNLDEIILYALGIESDSNYDYDSLGEYDSDGYGEDEDNAVINSPGTDENAAYAKLNQKVYVDVLPQTNRQMAQAVIAALLQYPDLQEPKQINAKIFEHLDEPKFQVIDPDRMLQIAVDKSATLVDKLLNLPNLAVHPACVLPKIEWHIQHNRNRDDKYQIVLKRVLKDNRIHQVNVYKLAWAASQGDLYMMEEMLNDRCLVVADRDFSPLYWAAKNGHTKAFFRLLDDPRFNNAAQIKALLNKPVFHNDKKTALALILLDKTGNDQTVYENVLENAIRGKALGLIKVLLETPLYAERVQHFDKRKIHGLFLWAESNNVHCNRNAEVQALLNTYFTAEKKPAPIAYRYQQYIEAATPAQQNMATEIAETQLDEGNGTFIKTCKTM